MCVKGPEDGDEEQEEVPRAYDDIRSSGGQCNTVARGEGIGRGNRRVFD